MQRSGKIKASCGKETYTGVLKMSMKLLFLTVFVLLITFVLSVFSFASSQEEKPKQQEYSFDLQPLRGNKIAFKFEVLKAGEIALETKWVGSAQALTLWLHGPVRKIPYVSKSGSSPLSISYNIPKELIKGKTVWMVTIVHSTGIGEAKGSLKITHVSQTIRASQVIRIKERRETSPLTPLFFHYLERYLSNVSEKSDFDIAFAKAMAKHPNAEPVLRPLLHRHLALPLVIKSKFIPSQLLYLPATKKLTNAEVKALFRITPKAAAIKKPVVRAEPKPRYITRLIEFKCWKEMDWDGASNSDEPYIIYTVTNGKESWTRRTIIFSDVDTGESSGYVPKPGNFVFGKQNRSPIYEKMSIFAVFMEHDDGNADELMETIETAVDGAIALINVAVPGVEVVTEVIDKIVDLINYLVGLWAPDDLVGTDYVEFTADGAWQRTRQGKQDYCRSLRVQGGGADYGLNYCLKFIDYGYGEVID